MSWPPPGAYGTHGPMPTQVYSPAPFQPPQYAQPASYQASGASYHANPSSGPMQPVYQGQVAPNMQNSAPNPSYSSYSPQGASSAPYVVPQPVQFQQHMNQPQQFGYAQGSSSYQPPTPNGLSAPSWSPNGVSQNSGYLSPNPVAPGYHASGQVSPLPMQGSPQPPVQNSFTSFIGLGGLGGGAVGGAVQSGQYQHYQHIEQQQYQQQQAGMGQQNLYPSQQPSLYAPAPQAAPQQTPNYQQNPSPTYNQQGNPSQGPYSHNQSGSGSNPSLAYNAGSSSPTLTRAPSNPYPLPSGSPPMSQNWQGPKVDALPPLPDNASHPANAPKKLPLPAKPAGMAKRALPEPGGAPKKTELMTTGSLKLSSTPAQPSTSTPSALSTHPPAAKKTGAPRAPSGEATSPAEASAFAAELSSIVAASGSIGLAAGAKKMPNRPTPMTPQPAPPSGLPSHAPPKSAVPSLPAAPHPGSTPTIVAPASALDSPLRAASIGGLARRASAAKPTKAGDAPAAANPGSSAGDAVGRNASGSSPFTPGGSAAANPGGAPPVASAKLPIGAQLGISPAHSPHGGSPAAGVSPSPSSSALLNPMGHEFTSTLVPSTKEAIKAAQYAQYSSTGENHSELPSKLFSSKRANVHTISILDSPKLSKMTSKLNGLKSLVSLTIRGCSITAIYGIENLGATLMKLDLGKNRISIVPEWISTLQSLQVLTLDNNALNVVPKAISQLPSLVSLDLSNNYLSQLDITGLNSLTSLAIASNNFTVVPPSIDRLHELQTLDLGHNRFEMLPRNIYSLPKLQCLIVSGNKLGDLPAELCLSQKLNTLHWDDNRATKIHDALFTLTKLTNLKLGRNTIGEMSERVSRLSSLRVVELDSNHFDILPHQLCALPKLELTVSANPFRSIPEEIRNQGQGAIIQFLRQLSSKAPWRRMKLMLVGNGNIGKTSLKRALITVPVPSNSLISAERAGRLKDKAFDSLRRAASTAAGAVSNVLGGSDPSIDRSAFDPTDTIATDGIDIDDWVIDLEDYPDCVPAPKEGSEDANSTTEDALANTAVLSCYDFAGQDVYYPTHSLFVTSRSIYLVMFSLKDLEGSRVEYWLQMVQAKAGYSSPVVIVATHEDHRSVDRSTIAETLAQVKKKYSRFAFVKGVVSISSKTGAGVHNLRKQIVSLALSHATMKEQVPRSYILVESEIKKRRKLTSSNGSVAPSSSNGSNSAHQQTMTIDEWYALAEKCTIKKEDALAALQFMADVGVVFHFRSNPDASIAASIAPKNPTNANANVSDEGGLDNVIILDPQWIADLLSTVISLKHNYIREGVLESSVLPQLWKTYPVELHQSLIALLKRFEIVLPMASAGKFIVPSMLPTDDTPLMKLWQGHGQWYGPMARLLSMKFCPMGFFGRFVARAIHLPKIKVISYSMTYFVCENPVSGERAVVAYNEWTYEILIWSASMIPLPPSQRSLLYTLADSLDILHESLYASNRRTQYIVCPHCIKCGYAEPTLFEYDDALIAFTDNIPTLPCYNLGHVESSEASSHLLRLRTASMASFAAILGGNKATPPQPPTPSSPGSARIPAAGGANGVSNGGIDVGWVYSPTNDVFPAFTQRKEKHKSESVFAPQYDEHGEVVAPQENRQKTDVPLEQMAPDVSFHSLGDMVVPYDSVKLGNLVAVGGFAEIYKSEFRGETVAVKKFLSSKESDTGGPAVGVSSEFADAFRELQHEAFLMAKLRHPNVVSLNALCVSPICMIMEWIPEGTLGDVLFGEKAVPLNWETRLKYATDVATGLAYLHAQSIMHLDFRSPNLLIKSKNASSPVCIKVADFGLSTTSSGSHKGVKAFNPFWSSPEIILRKTYDLSTDIYSLGIVLWELLQNGRPFEEHQPKYKGGPEIVFSTAIAAEGLRPSFPAGTPESLKKLISDCWQVNSQQRPSAADVVRELENISMEFYKAPSAWAPPFFLPASAASH